jgi:hypothetical protein
VGGTANLEAPTSQNFKQGLLVLVACHPLNFFLIKEEIKEWNPKAKFVFFLKKRKVQGLGLLIQVRLACMDWFVSLI